MNPSTTNRRLLTPLPLPVLQVLVAALVMSLGVLIPWSPPRALIVLPLAALAPGYAVVIAVFGLRKRIDVAPTLALSAVLSLALYPLLAVLMYAVGIHLSTPSVVISTDIVIVLMVMVVALRTRLGLPAAEATHPSLQFDAAVLARSTWNGLSGGVRFVATVVVATVLLAGTMHALPKPLPSPFTSMSLHGPWAHINAVIHATPHKKLNVEFSLSNHTNKTQTYHIVTTLDKQPVWSGHTVTLRDGATWVGAVGGYVPAQGCVHQVVIAAHLGNDPTAVASLVVWVRGAPGLPASCQNA